MSNGIYVALSGAIAQETSLETTATNLANASTPGYQKLVPVFRESLARATKEPGLRYVTAPQSGSDTSQGAARSTGNALDFVVPKGAHLAVQTPQGERYTRAGSLHVAQDGTLMTASGQPVLSETQKPIKVPAGGEAKISNTGDVLVNGEAVGKLRIVRFANPARLAREGANLMRGTPEAGAIAASTDPLEVGAVEESNANVVSSMTDLVTASRTFEAFQRAIETFRDADRKVTSTVPNVHG
jgi:flagellar basal body rod protein FlgG